MTCLPDGLWTDPGMLLLVAKHRRLWVLAVAIARLRARWLAEDVDLWTLAQWVIMLRRDCNVNTNERQLGLDLAKMRTLNVLDAERIELRFCRRNPASLDEEQPALPELLNAGGPRRRHPSDDPELRAERRRQARLTSANTPPVPPPHTVSNSARHSTNSPPPVTVQLPESVPVTGQGDISPYSTDSGPVPEQNRAVGGVRVAPPRTTVERLVELGMVRTDAERRVTEFGDQRCGEAIDAIAYWPRPVQKPIGFVVDYLVNKRTAPKGLIEAWERQAQQNLPMLGTVPGGQPETPAVKREPVPAAADVEDEIEASEEELAEIAAWRAEWAAHCEGIVDAA